MAEALTDRKTAFTFSPSVTKKLQKTPLYLKPKGCWIQDRAGIDYIEETDVVNRTNCESNLPTKRYKFTL